MRCPTWFVIGLLNLGAISAAGAVDRIEGVQIVPRNNGVSRPALAPVIPGATIVGNEIRLPKGGVNVELELIVSGWENYGNALAGVDAGIDLNGFLGANASPAAPGVDLRPLGFPNNNALGAFQLVSICQFSGRDCGFGQAPCATSEGICIRNDRFAFFPETGAPNLVISINYRYSAGVGTGNPPPPCVVDPGEGFDPLEYGYVGTIILEVPQNAIGSYLVPIASEIDNVPTWFTMCYESVDQAPPELVGATITILDCDQDGISDGQEIDDGTAEDCNGNFVPDECESLVDGDGDGAPDVCDGCPDDVLKTQPGVCGCNISEQDLDQNGTPDCVDVIPAASTWGLLVLALMLLAGAKVVFTRRTVRTR